MECPVLDGAEQLARIMPVHGTSHSYCSNGRGVSKRVIKAAEVRQGNYGSEGCGKSRQNCPCGKPVGRVNALVVSCAARRTDGADKSRMASEDQTSRGR